MDRLKRLGYGLLLSLLFPVQSIAQSMEFERGNAAYENQRYQEAAAIWLPLARNGDVHAQFQLATLYDEGLIESENNRAEAFKWYELAALQGHPVSGFNLGNAYKHGRGTIQSEELASYWWQKASDANIASAQFNLALQYHRGLGVAKDPQRTVELINRAAGNGHEKAAELMASGQVPRIDTSNDDHSQPIQAKSTDSAADVDPSGKILATEWLMMQNPDDFCIQLAVMSSEDNVQRFIQQYDITHTVKVPVIVRGGQTLHYVLMGQFTSRERAKEALDKLPLKARRLQPWPRSFGQLQSLAGQEE